MRPSCQYFSLFTLKLISINPVDGVLLLGAMAIHPGGLTQLITLILLAAALFVYKVHMLIL